MPSLSLSGSGQPSSSWKPSLSSGSFGHLSFTSAMPSASLSGSGQPSSSWKPSLSSGSLGHSSTLSLMPSPSLSPITCTTGGMQRSLGDFSTAALALVSATSSSDFAG